MIRAFTGKPGGGKSYRALLEIIEELIYGDRVVCTNVALDLGELNAFLQERYPKADINLFERVRLLSDAQCRKFWLHRERGVDIPDVTREQENEGTFPALSEYLTGGVMYVIDEAHKFFDARSWQTAGLSLTHYNSQHRKLNDEVVFVTQFPELLDKRCRGFVQEWHNCRNYGLEKIFTFFRMPRRFYVKVTQNEPSLVDQPGNMHIYRLDLRVAACYDTSAGVGITGRRKPERQDNRGLSLYWLLPVGLLALVAVMYAPDWIAHKALGTDKGKKIRAQYEGTLSRPDVRHPLPHLSGLRSEPEAKTSLAEVRSGFEFAPDVRLDGWFMDRGHPVAVLSDGTELRESDLRRVGADGIVTAEGQVIRFRDRQERLAYMQERAALREYDPAPLPASEPVRVASYAAPTPPPIDPTPVLPPRTVEEIRGLPKKKPSEQSKGPSGPPLSEARKGGNVE